MRQKMEVIPIAKIALLHNSFKQSIFILFYLSDSYALKQVV